MVLGSVALSYRLVLQGALCAALSSLDFFILSVSVHDPRDLASQDSLRKCVIRLMQGLVYDGKMFCSESAFQDANSRKTHTVFLPKVA